MVMYCPSPSPAALSSSAKFSAAQLLRRVFRRKGLSMSGTILPTNRLFYLILKELCVAGRMPFPMVNS